MALIGAGAFWLFSQGKYSGEEADVQRELARMLKENPEAEVLGLAPEEKKK